MNEGPADNLSLAAPASPAIHAQWAWLYPLNSVDSTKTLYLIQTLFRDLMIVMSDGSRGFGN